MAPQGTLEYPNRRSSQGGGWTDMETGSVEALEQVETRKRKKRKRQSIRLKALQSFTKGHSDTVSSSVEGASPKVMPLPTLGSRKK